MPKSVSTRSAYKMLTCIYLCRTLLFFAPYADFLKKTNFAQTIVIHILVHISSFLHHNRILTVIMITFSIQRSRKAYITCSYTFSIQRKIHGSRITSYRFRN